MHVKELAPDMGPAGGFGYVAFFEDGVKARIAVSTKYAFEVFEMRLRMLTFAVWRIKENSSWRLI